MGGDAVRFGTVPILAIALSLAGPAGTVDSRWMNRLIAQDRGAADLTIPTLGDPFRASLVRIDSDGTLVLRTEDRERDIAAAELVRWGGFREDNSASRVILRDGGILVANITDVDESSITIESALWHTTKIARRFLAGIIFTPPARQLDRDRLLQSIRQETRDLDTVLLRNGDEITGTMTPEPERTEPADPFGLRRFGVALRVDQKAIAVSVDDCVAVLLRMAGKPALRSTERLTWLGFRDGSLLAVHSIDSDAAALRLELAGGLQVTLGVDDAWNHVCLVQPLGNAARYLSDLTPIGYRHAPFLALKRGLGIDRNVHGGQLRSGATLYLKGLGMPTTSRVVFEVGETDRRFAADLALDDAAGQKGSAIFRVFVERQEEEGEPVAWEAAYTSPIIRGGAAPRPISLDLAGATKIALIVDFADHGDAMDLANWLNARFLP